MSVPTELRGRLVLADEVVPGRLVIEDGWIRSVEPDPADAEAAAGPHRTRPGSSTSTSTAGAATTPWATRPPSPAWPGRSSAAA